MNKEFINIYTDGSCHTRLKTGCWAAIVLFNGDKIILKETVAETTHNRMELMAPIKAIEYVIDKDIIFSQINIYSDSQYVVNLSERKEKLKANKFITKKGKPVRNGDLVKKWIGLMESIPIQIIKVAAHQKKTNTINYNREVDRLVRKMLREQLKGL